MKAINELCDVVRETCLSIHQYHRSGHLEKVYWSALFHRLKSQGIPVFRQDPLTVYDEDGTGLGRYYVDLLVDGRLVIELKACRAITTEHVAQLLGYLRTSKTRDGLLINFGALKRFIKKYVQD